MDSSKLMKIVAIIIIVVMALSMIAVGFLYLGDSSEYGAGDNNTDLLPTPSVTPFTYSVSFDSNAIKDVGTLHIGAFTSEVNKSLVDSAVLKIAGVSKVSSEFRKISPDSNEWIYLADVALKKGSVVANSSSAILDLNFFNQSRRAEFLDSKYITVSVPPSVILHNSDLNIDRNYSFESSTLSILAGPLTMPGDRLVVSGTVKLAGSSILELVLMEEINLSNAPVFDENSIIFDTNSLNAQTDSNTNVLGAETDSDANA